MVEVEQDDKVTCNYCLRLVNIADLVDALPVGSIHICKKCRDYYRQINAGYTTREVANGLMQMASARPSMHDFFPSDAQLAPDNAYQSLVINELVDISP